jgi:hypothetical protein
LEKIEIAIKKQSAKSKTRHRDNSGSDLEGIGLGSKGKIAINLGKTLKKTKFTPPSPIKASPTPIASNQDDVCPTSFSNAGDVMMTSSS